MMQKAQMNIETVVGMVVVIIVYAVGFGPILTDIIANATGLDPLTASILSLIPATIAIGIFVWILSYAFGRRPAGAWGGQ